MEQADYYINDENHNNIDSNSDGDYNVSIDCGTNRYNTNRRKGNEMN